MVADFCEVLENKQCIDALAQVTPSLIAVASSSLHGSNWGGSIHLVKPGEGILHSRAVPCGVPDLCAAGGRGLLVAAEDSGDIAVYSVGEDLPLELAPASVLAEHHDIVSCVCSCTSSPAKIVSGSWDTSIKLWDIGGGEESIASLTTLWDPLGDSAGVVVDACWESTGGTADVVACCFRGKMLKLWDTREAAKKGTAQEISLPSVPCCVTWAQHSIAIGCEDGSVALIDSRAPAEPWTVTKVPDPKAKGHHQIPNLA
ncbi:unnamed protein product [Chrysoparadoxa australica]